jgi:transposase InsO family protein
MSRRIKLEPKLEGGGDEGLKHRIRIKLEEKMGGNTLDDKIDRTLAKVKEMKESGELERLKEKVRNKIKKEDQPLGRHKQEELNRYYYDTKTGFTSAAKLAKKAKARAPGLTFKQTTNWVKGQEPAMLTAPTRKPTEWNSITAPYAGHTYQMDLMIYKRYAYDGFSVLLNVIDVHSRFVGSAPLKGKHASKVLEAFQSILSKQFGGRYPKNISLDKGTEFTNGKFVRFCEAENIRLHFSQVGQFNKNSIVERFNGTLAKLIQRWRIHQQSQGIENADWVTALPDLIYNYNHTYHSTIKAVPADVWEGKDKNKQEVVRIFDRLREGDRVKRKIFLKAFSKGDELRYSAETYVLTRKVGNRWELKDEKTGEIYRDETMRQRRDPRTGILLPNPPNLYKEDQLKKVDEILVKPTEQEYEAKQKAQEQGEKKFIDQEKIDEKQDQGKMIDEAGEDLGRQVGPPPPMDYPEDVGKKRKEPRQTSVEGWLKKRKLDDEVSLKIKRNLKLEAALEEYGFSLEDFNEKGKREINSLWDKGHFSSTKASDVHDLMDLLNAIYNENKK